MELNELRALVAVADTGSLQAAAHQIGKSRPSVSGYLQRLETELGCQLIDRSARPVTPTPAGRPLIDEARTSLQAIDRAAGVSQRIASADSGQLRLGHNGTAGVDYIQTALRHLNNEGTDLALQVREGPSNILIDLIADRALDLALVRPPIHHRDIDECWLSDETFVLAVPSDHPLAAHKTVDLAQLANERFVLPPRSLAARTHDFIVDACWTHGHFAPKLAQEATTTLSFLALVAAGTGIAILPDHSIAYCKTRGVKRLRLTNPLPRLPLHLAWHRQETNPYLHHLRTAIISAAT